MSLTRIPALPGLTETEKSQLRLMQDRITAKQTKNALLDVYYEGHRAFQDLGISIPPQMQRTRAALGWPQKAVQALARKHVFEGYTVGGLTDTYDLGGLLARNEFETELAQAITSAYKHSVSFLTVAAGDVTRGEPPVMIQARDAKWTTALWDQRTRTLEAALALEASTAEGTEQYENTITGATMYTRSYIIHFSRQPGSAAWHLERMENPTGRVLVEPLVYDPQLGRPFGRSRITTEVRYLTDAAVRTLMRAETGAEFFSSPQRYVLGASEDAFTGMERWSAITGRLLALTVNEEGSTPTVGQFTQLSMEPHLAMYRQLAQNFCAATNLPMSTVGIFGDNPASAEAMQAAEYQLSDEADYQWRIFTPALRRLLQDVLMIRDRLTEPPEESWDMAINYTPTRYVSPQASADVIAKIASALPDVATTTVGLRRAGFTQAEIEQVRAENAPGKAASLLERLAGAGNLESPAAPEQQPLEAGGAEDPVALKAKFDALGVAIRAGIEPQDAALRLGLDGLRFTGAVPVSLRMPEADADKLEAK